MAEYIEREAAREILCGWCRERELCDGSCLAEKELDAIPAADVAPVRHGRWIEQPHDFDLCGIAYYQCSECGKEQQTPSNYCQFCGARMDGDGE